MKFLLERYKIISICLSLLILTLAFIAESDAGWNAACVTVAFLAGIMLHAIGVIKERAHGHMFAGAVEICLTLCMCAAFVLALLHLGGIL